MILNVPEKAKQPNGTPSPTTPEETEGQLKVDWLQALGVGFGAGILVALIGVWQVREIRRRRQPRSTAEVGGGDNPRIHSEHH